MLTKDQNKLDKENTQIFIATLNTKTLRTQERLYELENALHQIKWDILGLSEIRRPDEKIEEYEDYIFYQNKCEIPGRYGVGFLVKKHLKERIIEFVGVSDRIAILNISLHDSKHPISIVQVYAPTELAKEEAKTSFYNKLQQTMEKVHKTVILIGDLNAQIGKQMSEESKFVGPFTHGKRNSNGQKLIDFVQEHNLCIMNSFYNKKKNRKWTWIAPGGKVKNEIDFIITNKPKLFMDVSVINQFNFDTDHRLVRGKIYGTQTKQPRWNNNNNTRPLHLPIPEKILGSLEHVLQNKMKETDNLQDKYNMLENVLRETEQKTTSVKIFKDKIGEEARELIKKRQALRQQKTSTRKEISDISKNINQCIRKHRQKTRTDNITYHIESTGGVKKAWKELQENTDWIPNIKDKKIKTQTKRSEILEVATDYYRNLYNDGTTSLTPDTIYDIEEEIPPILPSEIIKAIQSQKDRKASGEDGISNELLKGSSHVTMKTLSTIFNEILTKEEIPTQWTNSTIILLHKKGKKDDISNYRPISLMSNLYKIFSKIILDRITMVLDDNQPKEQAGFRKDFSTVDHIHTIKQIIEKYQEYRLQYYIAFVDYNKAFDSLKHNMIWKSLLNQGVSTKYIRIIRNIYKNMTAKIRTEKIGDKFSIKKGVRQGDPLSPKLFSATLESVFRQLDWTNYGIKVNGALFNHLRFADDLIILSDNPNDLLIMLEQLVVESAKVGLQLNALKTKVMTNHSKIPIMVNNSIIEYVEEYTYLGQIISPTHLTSKEIQNRINSTWKRYWSLKEITKNPEIPLKIKSRVFNSCILPIMTYGCQTWPLTKENISKLETCQHSIERSMLNVRRKDRISLALIRNRTKIADITHTIKKLKWKWAGHILRCKKDKWAKDVIEWYPREGKRARGRPFQRWEDDISVAAGVLWRRKAQDRKLWKRLGEAYAEKQNIQITDV